MKAHDIEKKQIDRFKVLYHLYCSTRNPTDLVELCYEKEIRNGVFESAYQFLSDEKLLAGKRNATTITHEGTKIVERAILHPEERSDLFPPFKEMGL